MKKTGGIKTIRVSESAADIGVGEKLEDSDNKLAPENGDNAKIAAQESSANDPASAKEGEAGAVKKDQPKISSSSSKFYGHLLEAQSDKTGKSWEVVLIEAGESKNGVRYGEELLKSSAHLFEGARAYAYEFTGKQGQLFDHLPQTVRDRLPEGAVKNLVGDYSNARFGDFRRADGTIGSGIIAKFNVTASWLRETLSNAWEAGRRGLIGFSIDALAKVRDLMVDGGRIIKEALSFERLDEVTVVSHPGAGGIVLNVLESVSRELSVSQKVKEDLQMKELWAHMKEHFAQYLDGVKVNEENLSESTEVILGVWRKIESDLKNGKVELEKASALAASAQVDAAAKTQEMQKQLEAAAAKVKDEVKSLVEAALTERANKEATDKKAEVAARSLLESKLKESNLPEWEQAEVVEIYGAQRLTEAEINRVIKAKQMKLDAAKNKGAYFPNQVRESAVEISKDQYDKLGDALEGALLGAQAPVNGTPPFTRLFEAYREITGYYGEPSDMAARIMNDIAHSTPPLILLDSSRNYRAALDKHVGRLRESRGTTRLQENALQTSMFAELLSDRQYKVMLKSYNNPAYEDYRKVVSRISSVSDFKTQRRIRMGGFADLSAVAELGTYSEFTWPADEEVTFTPNKYGNLAPLSMESILNDELGQLQQIPRMIGDSAARTLYKFVFDFFRNPPTMPYDSVALFHASHGNLGATALSDAALSARFTAMGDQTELSSGEIITGLRPKYIIVPNELERTAWEVATATVSSNGARTETIENWYTKFGLIPLRVQYWSDANDWVLLADPSIYNTIEIAFLNGRQEPEFFIADAPQYGAMLTADQVTYKVRFIFGGAVLDHRTMDKSVVA